MIDKLFPILLEASFCLILFAGLYVLLFKKRTFFHCNRAYLLLVPIISLLIPILEITPAIAPTYLPNAPEAINEAVFAMEQVLVETSQATELHMIAPSEISAAEWGISLAQAIVLFYLIGVSLASIFVVRRFLPLFQFLRKYDLQKKRDHYLVNLPNDISPFSFGNVIFLPKNAKSWPSYTLDRVLQHELAHIRQRHSLDILWYEIFGIVFWFLPVIPWYKKQIREVHEYLADRAVLQQNDLKSYGELLMKLSQKQGKFSLGHAFAYTPLKQRIKMMKKKSFHPKELLLFVMPALVAWGLWLSFAPQSRPTVQASIPDKLSFLENSDSPLASLIEAKQKYIRELEPKETVIIYEKPRFSINQKIILIRPVPGQIVSGFGMRTHPITKKKQLHSGIDMRAKMGTSVLAAANGVVVLAEFQKDGYGNYIDVQHENGYKTRYSQLSKILVKKGDKVIASTQIAKSGNSGLSKGPHLHFELWEHGKPIDPVPYLFPGARFTPKNQPGDDGYKAFLPSWPIKGIPKIYSAFGMRMHPVHKVKKMHQGLDFQASMGTPLFAIESGTVILAESGNSGYGQRIDIKHADGHVSSYAHLSSIEVKVGETVKKGQQIGKTGNSGLSAKPHLHFEIKKEGKRIDPLPFYKGRLYFEMLDKEASMD